jgi:hypothetical protein
MGILVNGLRAAIVPEAPNQCFEQQWAVYTSVLHDNNVLYFATNSRNKASLDDARRDRFFLAISDICQFKLQDPVFLDIYHMLGRTHSLEKMNIFQTILLQIFSARSSKARSMTF